MLVLIYRNSSIATVKPAIYNVDHHRAARLTKIAIIIRLLHLHHNSTCERSLAYSTTSTSGCNKCGERGGIQRAISLFLAVSIELVAFVTLMAVCDKYTAPQT
jgi:hypothetical protein